MSLELLGDNWALIVVALTTAALVLEKMTQSSEAIAKLLGPVGRMARRNLAHRAARNAAELEDQVQRLAKEVVSQITPADYDAVRMQLTHVLERLDGLEMENRVLRAFIVYDERWHFHDDLRDVGERKSSDWIDWSQFRQKYIEGWRPDG